MARVEQLGPSRFAVVHDRTGAVLKRKGKRVIYNTREEAQRDAVATRRRVMGR